MTNGNNQNYHNANQLRQRGVVLIVVLGVVAIIALASASVLQSSNLNIDRISRVQDVIQARELLNMGREWAALIIFEDMINGQNENRDFDNFLDDWAQDLGSPIEGEAQEAEMEIKIEDAQSRFNLNNLHPDVDQDEDWFEAYKVLITSLGVADANPDELAGALKDWIDQDIDVTGIGGAEDQEYSRNETPYRTANWPLTNLGELTMIQGYSPDVVEALKDHVVALPVYNNEATLININTATKPVFTTLLRNGFKDQEIDEIFDRLPPPPEPEESSDQSDGVSLPGGNIDQPDVGGLPGLQADPGDDSANVGDQQDDGLGSDNNEQEHDNAKGARFEGDKSKLENLVSAVDPDRVDSLLDDHFEVKTDYFIVTIRVKIDDVEIKERIVMSRYANKIKGAVNVSNSAGETRRDIIKYVQTSRIL